MAFCRAFPLCPSQFVSIHIADLLHRLRAFCLAVPWLTAAGVTSRLLSGSWPVAVLLLSMVRIPFFDTVRFCGGMNESTSSLFCAAIQALHVLSSSCISSSFFFKAVTFGLHSCPAGTASIISVNRHDWLQFDAASQLVYSSTAPVFWFLPAVRCQILTPGAICTMLSFLIIARQQIAALCPMTEPLVCRARRTASSSIASFNSSLCLVSL